VSVLSKLLLAGAVAFMSQPVVMGADRAGEEFFEQRVRPLLAKRCLGCHGGTKAGGGLSLETADGWRTGGESGAAIVPGDVDGSLLIQAIEYRGLEMPPAEAGGRLPESEVAILREWVGRGAPDPRTAAGRIGGLTLEQALGWWSFQPLPAVTVADVPAAAAEVDRLLSIARERAGIPESAAADRRTLLRRLTYDLTGLPPTHAELTAFEADASPGAYAAVIERLLSSEQYGIHWGRRWLDVVRYADTAGENTDRPLPHAWRYRNWVMDALNRDMPFDEFIRLQLAGDLLGAQSGGQARADGIIATGYLAIARRFGHDIDQDMYLTHEDVIDNLGRNFLGLTLGCARCHDHKYDPVTSADYYALYGIFESTRFAFPGCEPKGQPRDLVSLLDAAETKALQADYDNRMAAFRAEREAIAAGAARLKGLAAGVFRELSSGDVAEGGQVSLGPVGGALASPIRLKRGEVLQLTILPRGNHGADSTRVDLRISSSAGSWSTAGILDGFISGGPAVDEKGALWCFLDVTDGPNFLPQKKRSVDGSAGLNAWAAGDTPSAFVNASEQAAKVWTTLPGRSFFLHPGQQRNVAVAWICPADGEYMIDGAVADAHPAGLDGVSFRLEHFASVEFGDGLRLLAESAARIPAAEPEPPAVPVAYAVVDGGSKNARLQKRGDPLQPGDEIPRRWLTVFGGTAVSAGSGSGRLELAEWVSRHPLAARVLVNRVWAWHFGRGLVSTPNDFGFRGEPASHPELLDWLASQFEAGGWRLKDLHRVILQTRAWQRAAVVPNAEDPDNRWLGGFRRRRLTAEELRDSLLMVSGGLDLSPGEAHPFPPEKTWTFSQHAPFSAVYETSRRSAFLMVQRQRRHPFLSLFDGADPNASTPQRQTTTMPTQALYFINDPFFHAQAAATASRLSEFPDDDSRLRFLYELILQRNPREEERMQWREFSADWPGTTEEAWEAWVRAMLAGNEFLHVE
jgi:hypothetical protein